MRETTETHRISNPMLFLFSPPSGRPSCGPESRSARRDPHPGSDGTGLRSRVVHRGRLEGVGVGGLGVGVYGGGLDWLRGREEGCVPAGLRGEGVSSDEGEESWGRGLATGS